MELREDTRLSTAVQNKRNDLRESAKRSSELAPPAVKAPNRTSGSPGSPGRRRAKKPKAKAKVGSDGPIDSAPLGNIEDDFSDEDGIQKTRFASMPPIMETDKSGKDEMDARKSKSLPAIMEPPIEPAQLGRGYSMNSTTKAPTVLGVLGCDFCKYAWTRMIDVVDDHRAILEDAPPEVAIMVPWDESLEALDAEEAPEAPSLSLPPTLKVRASGNFLMYGKPGKLLVMQLQDDHPHCRSIPAEQLNAMNLAIDRWKPTTLMDSVPWALHDPSVTAAILSREAQVLALEAEAWRYPTAGRILHTLRICVPEEAGPIMNTYRDHFGKAFAFQAAWAYYFIQALWFLVPLSLIAMIFDFNSSDTDSTFGKARAKFEILKIGVIIWGAVVGIVSASRYQGDTAIEELQRGNRGNKRRSTMVETFKENHPMTINCQRWGTLLFLAIPTLILFVFLCMFTLVMTTNLILHVIYVWGDCYNLHTPEEPCRDAQRKHHIFGWAAEVGCDVGLAILFELFFAISQLLSVWISGLLNFKYESDKRFFELMLEVFLSALERIGFVGSLAFAFAPQWEPPHGGKDNIDMSIDCSDLMMGESSYMCLQRRLPASLRRWLLEKLMKGPFTVAPFISIMVKTIVPLAVYKLFECHDYCRKYGVWCWPVAPWRFVVRFFTLIFTLDGDNVACCNFPYAGWPFSNMAADSIPFGGHKTKIKKALAVPKIPESGKNNGDFVDRSAILAARKRRATQETEETADEVKEMENEFLNSVLDQGVRKPFLPADEMMELEMGFLWVLFFTPLRPIGVLTTLVARILEINFDMLKMTHVRRRSFPTDDKEMRRGLTSFVNCVILASFGWSLGLSLITYNDDLYRWGAGGKLIFVAMILWLFFCASLGFFRSMGFGCAFVYGRLTLLHQSMGPPTMPDTE